MEGSSMGLENAFMFTVFGYIALLKTDREAKALCSQLGEDQMREIWSRQHLLHLNLKMKFLSRGGDFIHTHHYEVYSDYFDSWIANHPRRTGESYFNQYYKAKFIDNNPAPKNVSMEQLLNWFQRFREAEERIN
jgi:hypothetical protein